MHILKRSLIIGGILGLTAGTLMRPTKMNKINKLAKKTFKRMMALKDLV
jgi:gas vesicle protein